MNVSLNQSVSRVVAAVDDRNHEKSHKDYWDNRPRPRTCAMISLKQRSHKTYKRLYLSVSGRKGLDHTTGS